MSVRLVCACLLVVPFAFGAARAAQTSAQKTALVTVVDQSGAALTGLSASDFVLREDNAGRQVVAAELSTDPLSISLLVDTSQPPIGQEPPTQYLRAALSTFVKTIHAASPEAQIALVEFAGAAVTTVDFSTKTAELDKTIQKLFPSMQSTAVLLEAVVDASRKLKVKPAPRRAIVAVTLNSTESSQILPKKVAEEVRLAGATFWAISIRGTGGSAPTRESVLNEVTLGSGGLHVTAVGASALESMLKGVANNLLSQYSVTFARPGTSPLKNVKAETTKGAKVLITPWVR